MLNRREFLGTSLGAGAALALTPELLRALQALGQPGTKLIQRAIPSSGEMLPVIGLTFANHSACAETAALKEVLRTFVDNGGKAFDMMHQSAPQAETVATSVVNELGIQNKLFLSWRGHAPGGPPQPGAAALRERIESVLKSLNVPRIDVVMVNPAVDPVHLAVLKEEKKAGRLRYIGVQVGLSAGTPLLESIMRTEPIDLIGVHYAIDFRGAEQTILPLAQERKIGVMAYYPFGGADTPCPGATAPAPSAFRSLFVRVGSRPVPEWAAEFDAKTWAQFFLKYVVSHPAVTVARVGTTKATHMLDDIGGGIGRLPNEAMRRRMADFIDALPPAPGTPPPPMVLSAAILDRYVGEYKTGSGFTMTFRRDGAALLAKAGSNPETPVFARSETRFAVPGGAVEFQLDGQGKVTGLVLEQGERRILLERR